MRTLDAMETVLAIAVVAVWLVVNAWATWVAFRDPYSEKHQKVFQLVAIWLVPVLGASFIFAFHRKPEPPTGTYQQSLDPPSDDMTTARHVGRVD
jgi:membrane-anchored protein YejM (alkaline phosphatase superfamily)